jgi:hypothetical protein
MAQTITKLGQGEYTVGSNKTGGYTTNLGNIYYVPQSPANPGQASVQNVPYAPTGNSSTTQNQQPSGGGSSGPDLSSDTAKNTYARSLGYPGWNEYQSAINQPKPPQYSDQELNDAYNPLLNYLNQAESALRSDYPTYKNEIENSYNTSKQALANGLQNTNRTIDSQIEQGSKQKLDAISEARRMYNELQMANQQRFGSASSAGQAASEIQGREFQRGTAKTQEQFQQLTQELGNKKLELEQNYQVSLQQLEDKKQASINEVNRQFQEKLLQINQQRANTEAEKANRRLQALQDYKNQVYAVQLQNYQLAQQLQMAKAQSDMEIENYAKQLKIANSYTSDIVGQSQQAMSTPINMSGYGTTETMNTLGSGGDVSQAVGSVGQNKDLMSVMPSLYN